ncbi:hypothetical protein LguiA_021300 [Lonicera macranthoides]
MVDGAYGDGKEVYVRRGLWQREGGVDTFASNMNIYETAISSLFIAFQSWYQVPGCAIKRRCLKWVSAGSSGALIISLVCGEIMEEHISLLAHEFRIKILPAGHIGIQAWLVEK